MSSALLREKEKVRSGPSVLRLSAWEGATRGESDSAILFPSQILPPVLGERWDLPLLGLSWGGGGREMSL